MQAQSPARGRYRTARMRRTSIVTVSYQIGSMVRRLCGRTHQVIYEKADGRHHEANLPKSILVRKFPEMRELQAERVRVN